jgi:hypothetical protein
MIWVTLTRLIAKGFEPELMTHPSGASILILNRRHPIDWRRPNSISSVQSGGFALHLVGNGGGNSEVIAPLGPELNPR